MREMRIRLDALEVVWLGSNLYASHKTSAITAASWENTSPKMDMKAKVKMASVASV